MTARHFFVATFISVAFAAPYAASSAAAETSVSVTSTAESRKPVQAHGEAKPRLKPGEAQGFNPQPDPPGSVRPSSPGETRGFNPQPDPPGKTNVSPPSDSAVAH